MICPSSDEESDNDEKEIANLNVNPQKNHARSPSKTEPYPSIPVSKENSFSSMREASPSPSVKSIPIITSEEVEPKTHVQEESDRKQRVQLYVFLIRCIAYPFVATQPTDMEKRQTKVNKHQLQTLKDRFSAFLAGETQILADEAFVNAVTSYFEVFLNSDRLARMVQSGGCSAKDLREVFKNNIDKRVKNLPEIDGLSKETVLSSWMAKFDAIYRGEEDSRRSGSRHPTLVASELILSKEQLYDMYQNILGIKKFEHQILFNLCQLDSADEQAAAIRRELSGRTAAAQAIEEKEKYPQFYVREGQTVEMLQIAYIDELRRQVGMLMGDLEALPVSRVSNGRTSYSLQKFRMLQTTTKLSIIDQSSEDDVTLSKSDVALQYELEVVVMEVSELKSLAASRCVYCTMEVEGKGEKLQTDQAEASKPVFDTQGDFKINHPLPVVKVKLFTENTGMLSIEDKALGKVEVRPNPNFPKTPNWYPMIVPKNSPDQNLRIKLAIRMERPLNMKHCGYLWGKGRTVWKKWKKRFFMLVQASQYNFAMCSYQEKKVDPVEMMQMDNFHVDYAIPQPERQGGRVFFSAVKEGEDLMFAGEDEQDRILWVQAMYRATGQSHKPVPPTTVRKVDNAKTGQMDPAVSQFYSDKAQEKGNGGLEYFTSVEPWKYDHANYFEMLQRLTLDHRLNDSYSCLGWFSPGQVFVLDEYCARYGVRGCHRHLCYLNDLLTRAERGVMIDSTLLHFSYAFCTTHIFGNKQLPEGAITITLDEVQRFAEIRERLLVHLKQQITHFRYCFPFGRPQGGLKSTLLFLERAMTESGYPADAADVKATVKKCLEDAALVNYTRVSDFAKVDEALELDPTMQLKVIINLAEMCIDVIQQNKEHHYESFAWFSNEMNEHAELFLSMFAVDMDSMMDKQPPDTWNTFPLFQVLNDFLSKDENLRNGKFHKKLRNTFAPLVVRYVDLMESSVAQTIDRGLGKDCWDVNNVTALNIANDILWKLGALQTFIRELHWPDEMFDCHIQHRLRSTSADMIVSMVSRTLQRFNSVIGSCRPSLDFVIPQKLCSLINVIVECRNQTGKLCAVGVDPKGDKQVYHVTADEELQGGFKAMTTQIVAKLDKVTDSVLHKLSRFDEGSLSATLLSLTKPGMELANSYTLFVRTNQDELRDKVNDELFVEDFFSEWYKSSLKQFRAWLHERADVQLHLHQLKTFIKFFKKFFHDFELQGVPSEVVNNEDYAYVHKRLTVEEATASVIGALGDDVTLKEFEPEDDK